MRTCISRVLFNLLGRRRAEGAGHWPRQFSTINSVIYVLFNVKNAMFLPERSLPDDAATFRGLVTNQVDRRSGRSRPRAKELNPNGPRPALRNRYKFIKRTTINEVREQKFTSICIAIALDWFARRAGGSNP